MNPKQVGIKELDEYCCLHNLSVMLQHNNKQEVVVSGFRPMDYVVDIPSLRKNDKKKINPNI